MGSERHEEYRFSFVELFQQQFEYKQATSLLATPELKVAVTCHISKTCPINAYSKSTNHS